MDTTADQFPSQPELAGRLPQFRLIRKLSETRMSVIYLAEEKALGDRLVAIKVLAPVLAHERTFRERFRREMLAAANLSHPNIVPVYAAPPDDELLYLVMPFVDGPNLRSLLQQGPLDPWRTAYVITEVAKALDFAHASGVVHRDVKPSNILLDRRTDRVYLCDFGIATPVSGERLTEVGRFVGTPLYIAPERIPDGAAELPPIDGRADVYSLGVVLYQCLTGQPPHVNSDTGGLLWAQQHEQPRPVSMLRPDLPRQLDQVVATAMARDPHHRYATCQQLADAVYHALTGRAPTARRMRRPLRWKPIAAIAAAVALVAAGAIVVPTLFDDEPSEEQLGRIPANLRSSCAPTDTAEGLAGSSAALSCQDGEQKVLFSLFNQQSTMDETYNAAVEDSGVRRGTGDCLSSTGAEHRYPNGGNAVGRALCYSHDGTTSMLWTDDRKRTIGSAASREGDDVDLAKAWSGWVGIPAFPTHDEQALMDLVGETNCRRSAAGSLELFRSVVAAIDCQEADRGARTVSYYRFSDLDGLRRTFRAHVAETKAPPGVFCADDPDNVFLGEQTYDLRSVDIGSTMCYTSEHGEPMLEWTLEPVLVMARATGRTTPGDLIDFWNEDYGVPIPKVVEALNKRDSFPNKEERTLLDHIPTVSRQECIRPAKDQIELNVGQTPVVAATVCGPPRGAGIVFYYQFADVASMNAAYAKDGGGLGGADCSTYPANFIGEAPYARGGAAGRLLCGNNEGVPYLAWTNDALKILVFAFKGDNPADMISWWATEAGPV